MNYEEQLEKLLTSYKLHDILSAHLQQFKSKSVDDITKLPLEEVPSVEGVITKQENIDRHPPLERILLLGNEIEKERTKEQREKLVRERAEAVFKSGDKEKIQDIASIVSGDKEAPIYSDKEAFISDCIEVSGTISYYILGILSKETVDYLNRETSGISDEELLKMFDLSINGSYCWLDSRRYNILVSLYIARQSAGLKNGIVRMFKESILHDLKSRYSFGTKDYKKAYNEYSVDDDTLTILAEAKLSDHISYNLFDDYEYKVKSIFGKKTKNILDITKTYPNSIILSNSRFDRMLRSATSFNDIFRRENSLAVSKSKNNKEELDGVFNFFTYIKNPNVSEEEGKEKIEKNLCDINALNEKYKSMDKKMNVFESILNAIGSEMLACDNTLTREAVLEGRVNTLYPVYITANSNMKYRKADKRAKASNIAKEDFEKALKIANETWVEIKHIRGNKNIDIVSRLLEYEINKNVMINGKLTDVYVFTKLPAIYRYNMINNDMITRKMEHDSDRKKLLISDYAKEIYDFLERWVDRYITEERNVIEYSYDKVIKEAGIKLDIDSSTPQARKNRQKLLKYVDNALEELVDKEIIYDYEPRIETEDSKKHSGRRKYYKFRIICKNKQKKVLANNH